jgi:hypothetical protein
MMASKSPKLPRTESSLRIGRAVKRLEKMTLRERIQLQVKAGLLTQEVADEALSRYEKTLIEPDQPTVTNDLTS